MPERDDNAPQGDGGANGNPDDHDDDDEFADVLAALSAAGRLDDAPPEAVAAAKSAFFWHTMDQELAELTYDSLLDPQALAGVRAGSATLAPRRLTFESGDLTVELESTPSGPSGATRRLIGQLVPPQEGHVHVRHAGGGTTVTADEMGRFTVPDLAPGPISLRVQPAGGAEVVTDWVLV